MCQGWWRWDARKDFVMERGGRRWDGLHGEVVEVLKTPLEGSKSRLDVELSDRVQWRTG